MGSWRNLVARQAPDQSIVLAIGNKESRNLYARVQISMTPIILIEGIEWINDSAPPNFYNPNFNNSISWIGRKAGSLDIKYGKINFIYGWIKNILFWFHT